METVTIQKTSKKLKGHLILCWLMFIVGLCWCAGSHANAELVGGEPGIGGVVTISVAVFWYVVTRFRIWWNHG